MYELHAAQFMDAVAGLERIGALCGRKTDEELKEGLPDDVRARGKQYLNQLLHSLWGLECRVSAAAVERAKAHIDDSRMSYADLGFECGDIYSRLKDELSGLNLLHLEGWASSFYEAGSSLFGAQVVNAFPGISYDIGEAAKCHALQRFTASSFHSIRCLEAAIRAMARCLDVPDPTKANDRNWGNMLSAVKGKIDAKWPGSSTRLNGDGRFFDEAYAALAAIQNPWRNATMHLDQKYSMEESRHILDVVGGLMKKLASRMSELGEPKA
jgi:hypothetical protein